MSCYLNANACDNIYVTHPPSLSLMVYPKNLTCTLMFFSCTLMLFLCTLIPITLTLIQTILHIDTTILYIDTTILHIDTTKLTLDTTILHIDQIYKMTDESGGGWVPYKLSHALDRADQMCNA